MRCYKCQRDVPIDSKFCQYCGTDLSKVAICPFCKSQLQEGMNFCPHCGKDVRFVANGRFDNRDETSLLQKEELIKRAWGVVDHIEKDDPFTYNVYGEGCPFSLRPRYSLIEDYSIDYGMRISKIAEKELLGSNEIPDGERVFNWFYYQVPFDDVSIDNISQVVYEMNFIGCTAFHAWPYFSNFLYGHPYEQLIWNSVCGPKNLEARSKWANDQRESAHKPIDWKESSVEGINYQLFLASYYTFLASDDDNYSKAWASLLIIIQKMMELPEENLKYIIFNNSEPTILTIPVKEQLQRFLSITILEKVDTVAANGYDWKAMRFLEDLKTFCDKTLYHRLLSHICETFFEDEALARLGKLEQVEFNSLYPHKIEQFSLEWFYPIRKLLEYEDAPNIAKERIFESARKLYEKAYVCLTAQGQYGYAALSKARALPYSTDIIADVKKIFKMSLEAVVVLENSIKSLEQQNNEKHEFHTRANGFPYGFLMHPKKQQVDECLSKPTAFLISDVRRELEWAYRVIDALQKYFTAEDLK